MKKFTKICLIVCLALACIGGICMCAGIALGSGPREVMEMIDRQGIHVGNFHIGFWEAFFGENEEERIKAADGMLVKQFDGDEIDSLDIDIKYGEVYIDVKETDQIEVRIDAPKRNSYVCKKDGRTMELSDTTERKWWKVGGGNVTVTVSLPEKKVFSEVELMTNAGKVDISHSLKAKEISLELDAGDLTAADIEAEKELSVNVGAGRLAISKFSARNMEIDCGMGEVELRGSLLGDGDISCGMGRIDLELEAEETDYDYEMECGLGSIELNEQRFTSLGSEKEINHGAGNELHLDCGMGEIVITTN